MRKQLFKIVAISFPSFVWLPSSLASGPILEAREGRGEKDEEEMEEEEEEKEEEEEEV